jgi:hypothetical protein
MPDPEITVLVGATGLFILVLYKVFHGSLRWFLFVRFKGCLHCGCELNDARIGSCLRCGLPLGARRAVGTHGGMTAARL